MAGKKGRLVVDTNVLMSTLINPDSVVWQILEKEDFSFKVPGIAVEELEKYEDLIEDKIEGREEDFEYLISELFHNIDIVPLDTYRGSIKEAKETMQNIDEKDTEFLALALENNSVIWSDDQDLHKQEKVKAKTTEEVIKEIKD